MVHRERVVHRIPVDIVVYDVSGLDAEYYAVLCSLIAQLVKKSSAVQETWLIPGSRKIPCRRSPFPFWLIHRIHRMLALNLQRDLICSSVL